MKDLSTSFEAEEKFQNIKLPRTGKSLFLMLNQNSVRIVSCVFCNAHTLYFCYVKIIS